MSILDILIKLALVVILCPAAIMLLGVYILVAVAAFKEWKNRKENY